jgi:hypothetical protein
MLELSATGRQRRDCMNLALGAFSIPFGVPDVAFKGLVSVLFLFFFFGFFSFFHSGH